MMDPLTISFRSGNHETKTYKFRGLWDEIPEPSECLRAATNTGMCPRDILLEVSGLTWRKLNKETTSCEEEIGLYSVEWSITETNDNRANA